MTLLSCLRDPGRKSKGDVTDQGSFQERSSIIPVRYIIILHKTMIEKNDSVALKKSLKIPKLATVARSHEEAQAPILKNPLGYPKVSSIFLAKGNSRNIGLNFCPKLK